MSLLRRIANLFSRSEIREDIDQEFQAHLEMRIEDSVAAGMSPAEARRDAMVRFGNPALMKERTTASDATLFLESLWADVHFSVRQLWKAPGFALTAIVTLALGIGANTATFSVVDAVMLRPLPYDHPEKLVDVVPMNSHFPDDFSHNFSYPDYFDFRTGNRTLTNLVSYHDKTYTLTGQGKPVHVDAQVVSWDLLNTLGVEPALGRGFSREEEKPGTHVALISHALWIAAFADDPDVLGRSVTLSGQLFTVIGVMPPTFRFPMTAPENGLWTTLAVDKDPSETSITNRGMHFLNAIGRLKPGVTTAEASQDLARVAANLSRQYPDSNTKNDSAGARSEISALLGNTSTALIIVLSAVGLVLLVACGNIANLLLARLRERRPEIAMRAALGAGRSRIIRQLVVESLVLSLAGGLAGAVLAFVCTPAMLSIIGTSIPRALDAGVDLRILAYGISISCVAGLVSGVVPAISASKSMLAPALKSVGRTEAAGRDGLRSALIIAQVALGLLLASSAGLLITSFIHLRNNDEGFRSDHLLTFLFETPDSRYKETRPAFYRQYFEKLRAIPGVSAAAGTLILPMTDDGADVGFENPEHPEPAAHRSGANVTLVTDDYFKTMEIPLLGGRDFNEGDTMTSPPVMIVDQAFAQKYFPGENILGKRIRPGASNGDKNDLAWREIVGVVGSVRMSALQTDMRPEMYLPPAQFSHWCCLHTVLRTGPDPRTFEAIARQQVASLDKDIPVTNVRTMQELLALQLSQPRFAMVLLGVFAALAILLTVVGLYGVMSYSVALRTREVGIRMALGARRSQVMLRVLREAGILLAAGIAIGVVASLGSASLLNSLLYGVDARNLLVLTLVSVLVIITGITAAYLPARRAAGIDPMRALRTD